MLDDHANVVYPEVDGLELLLGYKTQVAGGCKLLSHPRWGAAVYPATLFTTASLDKLKSAVRLTRYTYNIYTHSYTSGVYELPLPLYDCISYIFL